MTHGGAGYTGLRHVEAVMLECNSDQGARRSRCQLLETHR